MRAAPPCHPIAPPMMPGRRAVLGLVLGLPAVAGAEEEPIRGPTRPMRIAALGPPVDGVVREVLVVEGQKVAAGAVLVRLVDDVQAARVGLARVSAEAEGELRQAQAQLAEAQAVFSRTAQAAGRGAATEWEMRQSRSRVEVAKAAAEAAEERRHVERQRLDLEIATQQQLTIRAPFDGVVTKLETVPGATLLRTDRPVTVADLRVLEAVLYVPASLWPKLRLGEGYKLRLSEPVGRVVPARLRHLDPVMDVASGRFRAVFVIENPDASLPAGLEAELDTQALPA